MLAQSDTVPPDSSSPGPLGAASAAPPRNALFNGTVLLATAGRDVSFIMEPAAFSVKRVVRWTYSVGLAAFTTRLAMAGSMELTRVLADPVSSSSADSDASYADYLDSMLTVEFSGNVTLMARDYPGPGLSGNYDWMGVLSFTPNPVASAAGRRLLLGHPAGAAAAPKGGGAPVVCEGVSGGGSCPADYSGDGLANPYLTSGSGSTSRELQQAQGGSSSSSTLTGPVRGKVTIVEVDVTYPSVDADSVRGDNTSFLDTNGTVIIRPSSGVPQYLVPGWKKEGRSEPSDTAAPVRKGLPWWLIMVIVGGVLALLSLAVVCWLWVRKLRKRRREALAAAGGAGMRQGAVPVLIAVQQVPAQKQAGKGPPSRSASRMLRSKASVKNIAMHEGPEAPQLLIGAAAQDGGPWVPQSRRASDWFSEGDGISGPQQQVSAGPSRRVSRANSRVQQRPAMDALAAAEAALAAAHAAAAAAGLPPSAARRVSRGDSRVQRIQQQQQQQQQQQAASAALRRPALAHLQQLPGVRESSGGEAGTPVAPLPSDRRLRRRSFSSEAVAAAPEAPQRRLRRGTRG
jgi:hypothetical protein